MWELWYQQKFLDEDRLDVKIGQQSLDQEFMVSQNAIYFINTMFGWPMVPSADLPGGGPAYPLSALGARAMAHVRRLDNPRRRVQRQSDIRTFSMWSIRARHPQSTRRTRHDGEGRSGVRRADQHSVMTSNGVSYDA
jgi:hypothetical protein